MKLGDLVRVCFGRHEEGTIGIFIEDDTETAMPDHNGYPVITRARVLWDGQIYSTPLDQIEALPPPETK